MQKHSLTEGNITKSILWFAFPILIGNVFQQLYNIVDTSIIGNVLGDNALAAVGATAAMYGLVIAFANGFTNGFSVVLARYFGAKNEEKMRETVSWIYVLTVIIAIILTIVSNIFLRPLLILLHTPKNLIDRSDLYIRIIVSWVLITMLYNMFSAILRAIGNSRIPLYFLIISSLLNVLLDILFVKFMKFGIAGAAYATVIAQAVSVVLCIVYIWTKSPILRFSPSDLKWEPSLLTELLSIGFSMALMLVVVQIGSVALQRGVNSLGETVITAHIGGRKIDEAFMIPLGTLAMASSTFASQNLGAGKYDRIKKGIKQGILLAMAWSIISIIVVFSFGKMMIKVITGTSNDEIIQTAFLYLRINISLFLFLSILLVLRSSLQGLGRKIVPIMGSVVELVLKFVSVGIITKHLGYLGICITEPIIWVICAMMVLTDFVLFMKKLSKENMEVSA